MGGTAGGLDKAALQQTPGPVKKSWKTWLAVIWASYCGALHGMNTSNISGIMTLSPFERDFGFDKNSSTTVTNLEGWAVSSMLLGQLLGVVISGPFGEMRGRKPVILTAGILYLLGAVLMAANFGSYVELIVGRSVSGLGSGFGMTAGAIYISELAPRALRGTMGALYNVNIMVGVMSSYWINYGSKLHISPSTSWQWRVPMILQAIPGIVLGVGYAFFPESPRYLIMKNRFEEAKNVLISLRGLPEDHPYVVEELSELQARASGDKQPTGLRAVKELLSFGATDRSTCQRVILVIIIQTAFIMCGGNSITYFAPNILKSIGLNSNQVLLFSAVYGLIKVLSVLLYAFVLTERFGRRPLLLIGSFINMLCTLYLAAFLGVANISSGAPASPATWVAIMAICVFAVSYGFGWAPAFSLTTSEICPTRTRGTIVTLAFTYQNVLNFGITRAFPNMVATIHAYGPFALFTACTAVSTVWAYFAFPECKNRSMESMDELFNLPWYKVGPTSTRRLSRDTDTARGHEFSIVEDAKETSTHVERL